MSTNYNRITPWIVVAGDVAALLLFVFIGQREHEMVDPVHPLLGLLLTGGEFVLPWILVSGLLGAFRFEGTEHGSRLYPFFARALNAWMVAGPLAILLRALILGRSIIPTIFLVVALGLGGLFILAWRLIFVVAWRILMARPMPANI